MGGRRRQRGPGLLAACSFQTGVLPNLMGTLLPSCSNIVPFLQMLAPVSKVVSLENQASKCPNVFCVWVPSQTHRPCLRRGQPAAEGRKGLIKAQESKDGDGITLV